MSKFNLEENIIKPIREMIVTKGDLADSLDGKGFDINTQNKEKFDPSKKRCMDCKACILGIEGNLYCLLSKGATDNIVFCNFGNKLFDEALRRKSGEMIQFKAPSIPGWVSMENIIDQFRVDNLRDIIDYYIKLMKEDE